MEDKDFTIKNGVLRSYYGNEENVVIPYGVTRIDDCAFDKCCLLSSITIPNSVTEIGMYAFYACENLKSVTIPNSVISIGYYAFADCTSLKSIEIPNSEIEIFDGAFLNCKVLTNIEISNKVRSIGDSAFYGITPIKRPKRTDGKFIAYKAFSDDWTCIGFQYEIGKSYRTKGKIKCCEKGFHACLNPLDVFNYYYGKLNHLHFAEVELSGTMDFGKTSTKVAASNIKIIRELTASELAEIYNSMEKEI